MSDELKPCPFCGSDEIEYKPTYSGGGESHGLMRCLECGCTVPTSEFGKHVKEPYAEWNRRADELDKSEILETLYKMVEKSKSTREYSIGDGLTIKRDGLSESDARRYATWIREALGVE